MKLSQRDEYDADPATVFAMFCDEKFLLGKYEALGYPQYEVLEVTASDSGARIKTRRHAPANVPGFAKRLFGETTEMVQTDEWGPESAGVRDGTWKIDVPGKPMRAGGTIRLEPRGSGSLVSIDGELKASVPLIGGKLESWAGGEAKEALVKEYDFGTSWLAEH
jgi:Protein of unknown function (DUF2505)